MNTAPGFWSTLRRDAGYLLASTVFKLVLWPFMRLRTFGFGDAPPGPYVVAANHVSHFDGPLMCMLFPRKMNIMVRGDMWHPFFLYWFFTGIDSIRVEPAQSEAGAARRGLRCLREGQVVMVFPEGGIRVGDGSVLAGAPFPIGAAALAQWAGVPVRPCAILGTDQLYRFQDLWRRPKVLVKLGEPLWPRRDLPPRAARDELNQRLSDAVRALHAELAARPEATPEMLPRTAQERWA